MSSITIVALPADDEEVWDLSSEKKPHMTLLYMQGPLLPEQEIIQFVKHATETSLSGFGLRVHHRGTLGADDADVLFFDTGFGVAELRDFRGHLLKDDNIAKSWVKTEQYPGWIPHLTMGYPSAPAKEPEDKYQLSWINFDRIAVWVDDFDGPEFRLDTPSMVEQPEAAMWSEDDGVYIMHFGMKGMRWGVRKHLSPGSGAGNSGGHNSDLSMRKRKKDDKWRYKVNSDAPGLRKAAKYANRKDFEAVNKKPEYADLDFTKPSKLRNQYENDIRDIWAKAMTDYVAKKHGATNPSKTKKMVWEWDPKTESYHSEMKPVDVKHADGFEPVTVLLNDEAGYITGFVIGEAAVNHAEMIDDFIEHYGKRGMKWGVRRPTDSSGLVKGSVESAVKGGQKPRAQAAIKKLKATKKPSARQELEKKLDQLTTKEIQELNNRMRAVQDYKKLTRQEQLNNRSSTKKIADYMLGINQPNGKGGNLKKNFEDASKMTKLVDDILKKRQSSGGSSSGGSGSSPRGLSS